MRISQDREQFVQLPQEVCNDTIKENFELRRNKSLIHLNIIFLFFSDRYIFYIK